MMEKTIKLIRQKDIVIPFILFSKYKELKLTEEELVLIIYLINDDNHVFEPQKISSFFDKPIGKVLELVNELVVKDLLKIEIKIESKVHIEYLSLEGLYKKVAFLIVNEKPLEKSKDNIYDNFEKEMGRPLSPIEFELINGWQTNKISDDLILLALKEAVYNGAVSIRYIDRILFDWTKKGIKTKEDVKRHKQKFQEKKDKIDVFNYDWLNSDEDK